MEKTEFVLNDYANWKLENEQILFDLLENKSDIISKFKHVYDVLEELHEEGVANEGELNDDEEQIFESGFEYIFNEIENIKTILSAYFEDDFKQMEKHSELVNLLLYANDFESELLGLEDVKEEDREALGNFIDKVTEIIKEKGEPTEALHNELDKILMKIFGESYYGVNEIFLDIADEMGILDFDD